MDLIKLRKNLEQFGGQGSGNFGHSGRPGDVGGSGGGGGGSRPSADPMQGSGKADKGEGKYTKKDIGPGDMIEDQNGDLHYAVGNRGDFILNQDEPPSQGDISDPNLTGAVHVSEIQNAWSADDVAREQDDSEE